MTGSRVDKFILKFAKENADKINVRSEALAFLIKKSLIGGEISPDKLSDSIDQWFSERFCKHLVYIDELGYAKMFIDALKILPTTAPTDYGMSRQRDLGQIWGDMTRGYLAEHALEKFLSEKHDIKIELGHESGALEEYLPSDIHFVQKPHEMRREPRIKIGVKGSKWNGIWLDIPGAQFNHSDVHVFVKVGTGRDHLFAYFKHISVFQDKILKKGIAIGALNKAEAKTLLKNLPTFEPIPAYIAGFAVKDKNYPNLSYGGKAGRKHYTVDKWKGPIRSDDLAWIKSKEDLPDDGKVKFAGIEKFSHDSGYLFNTGSLLWQDSDWKKYLIDKL